MSATCECLLCGRQHRRLGHPPGALSYDDLCLLSRIFNERASLQSSQDNRINEWLSRAIRALKDKEQS